MYKIVALFLLLFLAGCGKKHVYHTYYGDIDTDTMTASFERDGNPWYLVRYAEKDSFLWDDEWMYMDGPVMNYYCPALDIYEEEFPDNHNNRIIVEIDPYHNMDWLKDD